MRASTIDDNAAWADLGASVVPFIYMGILNQYVASVKHDREVQKAAMKFNEILQNERKEAEKLAAQAQELAAQEKERADQAEERADQAEERAVQAQELAVQEKERADRAEGRLKELEKKLAELES